MFETQSDFSSYEPVHTDVTKAQNSPYYDPEIRGLAIDCENYMEEINEAAKSLREFHFRTTKQRIAKDMYSAGEQFDYKIRSLRSLVNSGDQKKIIGWRIVQKYRIKNADGRSVLTESVFIVDKKMKNVIASYPMEEEILEYITGIINGEYTDAELDELNKGLSEIKEKYNF